jgi:hypothetical protein
MYTPPFCFVRNELKINCNKTIVANFVSVVKNSHLIEMPEISPAILIEQVPPHLYACPHLNQIRE